VDIRRRLVPGVLIGGLVLAGGGSVIAASGGSSSTHSAANDQYCPPSSPGAGNPQGGPGNNCGNGGKCPNGEPKPPNGNCGNGPPETCPDGSPKPPPGNCGKKPDGVGVGLPGGGNGNPQGPPEQPNNGGKKKSQKARFHVKRAKAKKCYSKNFTLRVQVVNRGKGGRTTVARDGRPVKRTGRNSFTVNIDVSKLKRGVHKLTLQVKGKDGKLHTRTVSFRRC
jgi:hypothetical protein